MAKFSNKYLQEFKKLESKLKEISGPGSNNLPFREVLKKAKNKNSIIEFNEDIIDDLYGLRNVVAHADREKYIAEINQLAFDKINKILSLLRNPPTVIDVFKTNVFTVNTNNITEVVIKTMQENLYTHVPVYEDNSFIGALSETTILEWLVENINKGEAQFYKQIVGKINRKYLNSLNNLYKFVLPNLNIFEVLKIFEDHLRRGKRLGVIFITPNGKKDEKPVGIITAWDLPKIKETFKIKETLKK